MSNLQMIEAFCQIIELQSKIINEQYNVLSQHGLSVMEEEVRAVREWYSTVLGSGELPDI